MNIVVAPSGVEVLHGKVRDVEIAVRQVESEMWGYLFDTTPSKPLPSAAERAREKQSRAQGSGLGSQGGQGLGAGGKRVRSTAAEEWAALQVGR